MVEHVNHDYCSKRTFAKRDLMSVKDKRQIGELEDVRGYDAGHKLLEKSCAGTQLQYRPSTRWHLVCDGPIPFFVELPQEPFVFKDARPENRGRRIVQVHPA